MLKNFYTKNFRPHLCRIIVRTICNIKKHHKIPLIRPGRIYEKKAYIQGRGGGGLYSFAIVNFEQISLIVTVFLLLTLIS